MSAWYVMSAMGFYAVQPGSDAYVIGTPLFEKIRVHTEDSGKVFEIEAQGASTQKRYIRSASWQNQPFGKSWFAHTELLNGGQLRLEMSDKPSDWGAESSARPVSEITDELIVPVPFIAKGSPTFHDKQTVTLGTVDTDAEIFYSGVPGKPASTVQKFKQGILLKESSTLLFYARKGEAISQTQYARFYKIPDKRKVTYNTKYSNQYTGGGDEGLIDGIKGNFDFRTGDWQGFEGVPMDIVIDLGSKEKITCLSVRFLQDQNAWIFLPTKVQFEISNDGKTFSPLGEVSCPIDPKEKEVLECYYEFRPEDAKGRFVRVVAVPLGKCPDWHKGAGYPCWIFTDEVEISGKCDKG